MDHTAAVTIDLCNDCQIFVGPCKGRYDSLYYALKLYLSFL